MPGLSDLPRRRGLGALPDDYAALLASARQAMRQDEPVSFGEMEGARPSPDVPVDPMLAPPAVPEDAFSARFGKGLAKYPAHVFGQLASLPQRTFEASETRRQGGEYDPGPAVESALTLAGTGSAFAQPGAVGIFGGRLAKTADHAALARAEEMAAKGASREDIWNQTGWFQGTDQKWRFEIPDNAAKAGRDVLSRSASHPEVYEGRFGAAVDHPELASAYPGLSNMRVATHWAEDGGSFTPSSGVSIGTNTPENRAFLSRPSRIDGVPNIESPRYAKFGDIGGDTERGVALHEAQHAIQDVEGTARGGNPSNAMRMAEAAEQARADELSRGLQDLMAVNPAIGEKFRARNRAIIAKDYDTLDRLDAELYADPIGAKIMGLDWERSKLAGNRPADGRDAYERLAGEVEARNVQKRMDMTPEQRRATPPWLTEDVPADQQIVRFGSLSGSQESRAPAGAVGAGPVKGRPVAKMPNETVVQVDPRAIDGAWVRDRNMYVGPDGAGGSPEKYTRARDFLTSADQFEAPSLRMNEGGTPVFEDGRHRFAVMRDLGMDRVPVAIDPYSRAIAERYGITFGSGATDKKLGTGLAALGQATEKPQGIKAYHGSPHDFDRFDLSKIGTGEGAQVYGHGLYFAESEPVAEFYKKQISGLLEPDDIVLMRPTGFEQKEAEWLRHKVQRDGSLDERDTARLAEIEKKQAAYEAARNPGRMYEVNINADPAHFLDWDKPLSEQSEVVKKAFEGRTVAPVYPDTPGEHLPKFVSPDRRVAAETLRQAGIPGIKYLDQGSRGAGEGSRNYVVFDDKIIDILRKYGLAALPAGGAAFGALGDARQ